MTLEDRVQALEAHYNKQQEEIKYFVSMALEFCTKDYSNIIEKLDELDRFKKNIEEPIKKLHDEFQTALTNLKSDLSSRS